MYDRVDDYATAARMPPVTHWRWMTIAGVALVLLAAAVTFMIRQRQRSAEAASLLEQARLFVPGHTPASLGQARRLLERAAELDPGSPEVQNAQSELYVVAAKANAALRAELAPKALAAAQKAHALAPDAASGYGALIRYHRDLSQDWQLARAICEEAITRVTGDQPFLGACSTVESLLGNHEVARTRGEAYVRAHPNSPGPLQVLGVAYYRAGRLDQAEQAFRRAAQVSMAGEVSPYEYLALTGVARGQAAEALAMLDREVPYSSSNRVDLYAYRGFVAARADRKDEVLRMVPMIEDAIRRDSSARVYLSWVYLGLGESEKALAELERSALRRDDAAIDFLLDPATAELRGEERFRTAARQFGLPEPAPR